MIHLAKRQKFFLATFLVVGALLLARQDFWHVLHLQWRFRVVALALFSWLVTVWALWDEDFSGVEWVTLPTLPTLFVTGASLVYPLLPAEIPQLVFWSVDADTGFFLALVVKGIYLLAMAILYYASVLSSNIFNIAAIRTIQLFRAAHTTNFILTLVSGLLLFIVVSSLHLSPWWTGLIVLLVTFPLTLQSIWSINLPGQLTREVVRFAGATSLILAQLAFVLSFWPVAIFVFSLFLTVVLYELLGIGHYRITDRLQRSFLNELVLVGGTLLVLILTTTSWTGD